MESFRIPHSIPPHQTSNSKAITRISSHILFPFGVNIHYKVSVLGRRSLPVVCHSSLLLHCTITPPMSLRHRLQSTNIITIPRRKPTFLLLPSQTHFRVRFCSSSNSTSRIAMEPSHKDVVVADQGLLQRKISAIRMAGPSKFQVIADFDATLTKYRVNGRRGQSSHGLLQQGNPEYDAKRQALYEHYHPLEFSPTIPIEEKTKLMEEWWGKTHGLLIEGGLNYDAIKKSVASSAIAFREGVVELFEYLEERDIPILIFSAGLADIIEEVLRQKLRRSFKNIRIVSNRMVFDDDGNLVSFKGKVIHVLNKNEHALDMAAPLHDQMGDTNELMDDTESVKKRKNVLLLGDHIGDLGMSDGLNYENRVSVGFLNDNIEGFLDSYCKAFDIVYLNDAPMSGVVKLVSQLFSTAD